ncbi:MAG: DUF29 domain-containing protein [Methylococcales bacterium]|nr:DUF29 domain-containing protein [Methylococcales bacterium]
MINYQTDFYGWTQEQALLLKAGRLSELDLENLIEEVETMGRSEKRELKSRLLVLLIHLLKWQYQPSHRGSSWECTLSVQRDDFLETLSENPSLKPQLEAILANAYDRAKKKAAQETGLNQKTFPANCPWHLSQILDDHYYPDSEV